MSFRIVFMGSPDFAVAPLAALVDAGRSIACVYSQPPRPAGRGQKLRKTPVHAFAEARGIEVRTPRTLKSAVEQDAFATLDADLALVVAYGLLLPKPILDAPRLGCVNLHGSLLPRWRGAAPIQRAIMAGDKETGVQAMQMEEGLDTGPVYLTVRCAIEPDDTAGTLHDKLAALAGPLAVRTVEGLEAGLLIATPQAAEGMIYAKKIDAGEARIDWSLPAREVDGRIRGLSPFPGAWFELPTERGPVRVRALGCRLSQGEGAPGELLDDALRVACGKGALRLLKVQREGKQPMAAEDFLRGTPLKAGMRLA
jgi:methionyl-tRNA formyltransferase